MAYMAKTSLALLAIPPDLLKIKQEITLTKLGTNVFSLILPLPLPGVDHHIPSIKVLKSYNQKAPLSSCN